MRATMSSSPARGLVFSYELRLAEVMHSITLASLLLRPEGGGTAVTYTEQIVFLDGSESTALRQEGTEWHFARIPGVIGAERAA